MVTSKKTIGFLGFGGRMCHSTPEPAIANELTTQRTMYAYEVLLTSLKPISTFRNDFGFGLGKETNIIDFFFKEKKYDRFNNLLITKKNIL